MNGRTVVAAVVGAIVLFVLGFLIYGLALESFMKTQIVQYPGLMKNPPDFVPLILHDLVYAWFIAFIFDQWAGIRTFAGGFVGGALIMFSIGLALNLSLLAFMNIFTGLSWIFVDVAVVTFMGGITGGIIGAIMGKMGGEPAAA